MKRKIFEQDRRKQRYFKTEYRPSMKKTRKSERMAETFLSALPLLRYLKLKRIIKTLKMKNTKSDYFKASTWPKYF